MTQALSLVDHSNGSFPSSDVTSGHSTEVAPAFVVPLDSEEVAPAHLAYMAFESFPQFLSALKFSYQGKTYGHSDMVLRDQEEIGFFFSRNATRTQRGFELGERPILFCFQVDKGNIIGNAALNVSRDSSVEYILGTKIEMPGKTDATRTHIITPIVELPSGSSVMDMQNIRSLAILSVGARLTRKTDTEWELTLPALSKQSVKNWADTADVSAFHMRHHQFFNALPANRSKNRDAGRALVA